MFRRALPDLPGVALDDWDLLRRLQDLFDPYRPVRSKVPGYDLLTATDSRSSYSATNIDELREEIEKQDEPPESIRLYVAGKTVFGNEYELGITLRVNWS